MMAAPLLDALAAQRVETVTYFVTGEPTVGVALLGTQRAQEAGCDIAIWWLGLAAGASTSKAKMMARQAASGRRAHYRCNVLGWPWRMDFSRALAALMASRGRATLMSFLR